MADSDRKHKLAGTDDIIQDPRGFLHLGDDGVQRSYDVGGNVLDYRKLSNTEIMDLIEASKLPAAAEAEVKMVFAGVDGHDVTAEEQLLHPPEHLRPNGSQFNKSAGDGSRREPPNSPLNL